MANAQFTIQATFSVKIMARVRDGHRLIDVPRNMPGLPAWHLQGISDLLNDSVSPAQQLTQHQRRRLCQLVLDGNYYAIDKQLIQPNGKSIRIVKPDDIDYMRGLPVHVGCVSLVKQRVTDNAAVPLLTQRHRLRILREILQYGVRIQGSSHGYGMLVARI